ncbi:UNVERIFIED_CONTAM: hypothetical protein FKN15_060509 [Acipenser sinensis]
MATRWGICSAGKISHDFVVALKTLPREEHQVVVVAARELGRAQDFANRHNIPRAYGSYQELAQDKDIDVVYLGTIHPQHHPVGLLFLRAKKNLLCEKPLAMNMREVLELTAAARENDVFLMENGCALVKPLPRGVQGESYSRRAGTESWLCKVASLCWDSRSIALTDAPAALGDKIGRDCFSSPHYRTGACPREGCHGRRPKNYIFQKPLVLNEKHQGAFQRMVVAVAARELGRAQDFANRHNIPRAYGSYQELAQDKDIERAFWGERSRQALFSVADVVYLGTIHPQHHPVGLLFLRAKKNLLCEKPLAMNMREVLELTAAARENDVFLMEALWTRYFPASIQISDVLAQGVLGEVKLVRVEFGMPMLDVSRAVKKELGGGALLDIGVYCLQFACMVFNGERPESIQASGCLLDTGVDEAVTVVLRFSSNKMAVCICTVSVQLPNEAFIFGTKGTIKIPAPMWSPTSLIVNGNETQFPLPEPSQPLNFPNSTGLRYEAQEVRRCLLAGLKQSPRMTLEDTALLTSICDEARRQVGVVYCQDAE